MKRLLPKDHHGRIEFLRKQALEHSAPKAYPSFKKAADYVDLEDLRRAYLAQSKDQLNDAKYRHTVVGITMSINYVMQKVA